MKPAAKVIPAAADTKVRSAKVVKFATIQ